MGERATHTVTTQKRENCAIIDEEADRGIVVKHECEIIMRYQHTGG